jgi:hypothetical protein
VHGGLAELGRRRWPHRGLVELGKRRRLHNHMAKPNGKGVEEGASGRMIGP